MITTPWGSIRGLPEQGGEEAESALSAELAARPPRERLYAAMVAGCEQRGFDHLTVSDLLRAANLSRTTFYELFAGKEDCYVAALTSILEQAGARLENDHEPESDPVRRARGALAALIAAAEAQRPAARLCLVEPFVVGVPALEALDGALERARAFSERALSGIPGRDPLPKDLSRTIVGGIIQVLFRRLNQGTSLRGIEEPLWEWMASYEAPPAPLRLRGWRPKPPPPETVPPFALTDTAERIIRAFAAAVAEKGYRATTISDIASRAQVSQRTLYEYFENKGDLLKAALDSSGMQMAAAVVPATRRSSGWPDSVRAGAGATTRFFVAEPDFARLRFVEVYAAGLDAVEQRDSLATPILTTAYEEKGNVVSTVAGEAIIGALFALYHDWIRDRGTESLPELAPLATYIALAPALGAERACEVANGDGR